jgi:sec-independent protein translocase protein TatB
MLNIGSGEFLVILLVALIVLGPQRLPEAARQIGKVMGDLRRVSSGFQHELRTALEDADLQSGTQTSRRSPLEHTGPAIAAGAAVDPEVASAIAAATARAEAVPGDETPTTDAAGADGSGLEAP